jgi:nitrite reductase/ring-hydroxylating ferredoxin subunit
VTAVEPTTDTDPIQNRSRREVLCGLVVALLAPGALVACGESSPNGGGSGGSPGGSGGGGGGGASGTKLAALTDVPEGSGLVVDKPGGGKVLLVRSSGSEVKAYNAACTHQGTPVDPPNGGVITCPNHGSQFDAASGEVKKGPADTALAAVSVKVNGTDVVLA